MLTQCNACGGVYQTEQNGQEYYHVCPPLSAVELAAAVDAGAVTLPDDPATGKPETPAAAVMRRSYERSNKRDERPAKGAGILRDGDGATPIVDATPIAAPVTVDMSKLKGGVTPSPVATTPNA